MSIEASVKGRLGLSGQKLGWGVALGAFGSGNKRRNIGFFGRWGLRAYSSVEMSRRGTSGTI